MKILQSLVATAIFLLILVGAYYLHVNYLKVNVVFYAAIFDAVLSVIAASAFLFCFKYFNNLGCYEKIQLIIIWLFMGYALAISLPTVIDRSLSFYILEKIQQRGGGIRQDAFEHVFTQEYVKEHRLVDVRLTEQLESGTIVIDNGCVLLTAKGKLIADFSQNFRRNWLPKKRLLLGEYSDSLIDPFRSSFSHADYLCK